MYFEKKLLFLIAETPVHAGSGSDVGVVDLPIQREKYTELPKIESSGLKGCIREAFENYKIFDNKQSKLVECEKTKKLFAKFPNLSRDWEIASDNNHQGKNVKIDKKGNKLNLFDLAIYTIFGPDGDETHAGAMAITDARILLFPVKSLKNVFAWITCPMVLERFKKDLELIGIKANELDNMQIKNIINTIPKDSSLHISNNVVLEEFTFSIKQEQATSQIANFLADKIFPQDNAYNFWKEKLKKDLIILSDDDFTQFVKTSTEIITRTKIDSATGTVVEGALWTEEYLPQDSVMYSLFMFTQPRLENHEANTIFKANTPTKEAELVANFFETGLPDVLQIGGNQTLGKGLVRVNFFKDKN